MKGKTVTLIIVSGLLAGLIGNAVLGILFTLPPIQSILYNPELQSSLFLEITVLRNVPYSVAGLVVLSVIHSALYYVFRSAMPGKTWLRKGLFWGLVIWLMFWVFQEWFIYHTLLQEPFLLNLLELVLLLVGSLLEGIVIAFFLSRKSSNVLDS